MRSLREILIEEVEKISGVKDQPSPVAGGSALHYNGKEFAHFHHDHELDLKLTKKHIKKEKLMHPQDSTVHPKRSLNSQWIELRFHTQDEVNEVARLVKLAVSEL
ncbi:MULTISPECIES: luciferase family protein [unclassified Hahella]|uniref:luciferase domain-containing protein n=1 Tax=unclassified Hahella TaxID=2624107 RepID=UPI001C1EA546|nr:MULTISPECIES: luciferase family protein [unclassified Hahella]MBU6953316.1 DUF5519 family protein [Hahella sp. HN01]MDG9669405.1 DUF5519 family protein [Hahella sp. CR1]